MSIEKISHSYPDTEELKNKLNEVIEYLIHLEKRINKQGENLNSVSKAAYRADSRTMRF